VRRALDGLLERSGDAWYLSSDVSEGGVGEYARIAVQFLDVTPDPHEYLDFGLSGAPKELEIEEPPE
jgi:hypothetical protein